LIGASGLSVAEAAERRPPHQRRWFAGARGIRAASCGRRARWPKGTFTRLANGYSGGELNKMFG
jgi:methylisocitrate lyase